MHEEEELQHDISNLRDQVQQISLSQRETKDELRGDMDGLKTKVKGDMDGLKGDLNGLKEDIEGLKEGMAKLLQERLPSGDKVIHENND